MEKFKDFIYDKNDILIAFAIMALAALLIFWRLDVIMDYPEKILETSKETSVSETQDKDTSDKEDTSDKDTSDKDTSDKDIKNENEDESKNTDKKDTDDTQSSTPAPLWSGGQLTKDVTVVVQGASATEAINCLVSAELFKDYSEYQSICKEEGINHEKVSSGTFTFKKGWTKAEVADAVNWS